MTGFISEIESIQITLGVALLLLYFVFKGLLFFQIKHWVADYPLQGDYMLQKFKEKLSEYGLPLLSHANVHAIGTGLVGLALQVPWRLVVLAMVFDLVVHFVVDRIKASPKLLGRYKALNGADFMNLSKGYWPFSPQFILGKQGEKLLVHIPQIPEEDAKDLKKRNKYFWWSLGGDQSMHHITHYVILFCWSVDYIWRLLGV